MNKFNCFLVLLSSGLLVAAASNKIKPANQAELDKALVAHKDKPIVAEFFASWCGPCQRFDSMLNDIAQANPDIAIIQLDTEKFGDLAQSFGAQSTPTSFLIEKGKALKPGNQTSSVLGADKQKLENAIASIKGKKNETNDVKAPEKAEKITQTEQPQQMGMADMMIHQTLGADLYRELKDELPQAIDKVLQSDKVLPLIDRLADLIGDFVKEIVANIDLNQDLKTKLTDKLAEAKKNTETNFKQVEPVIKQMNPAAHKMAKAATDATVKVLEKARTEVAAKKATSKPAVPTNGADAKKA